MDFMSLLSAGMKGAADVRKAQTSQGGGQAAPAASSGSNTSDFVKALSEKAKGSEDVQPKAPSPAIVVKDGMINPADPFAPPSETDPWNTGLNEDPAFIKAIAERQKKEDQMLYGVK